MAARISLLPQQNIGNHMMRVLCTAANGGVPGAYDFHFSWLSIVLMVTPILSCSESFG